MSLLRWLGRTNNVPEIYVSNIPWFPATSDPALNPCIIGDAQIMLVIIVSPFWLNLIMPRSINLVAFRVTHNERDEVSNHRCLDCLLNRFFRCRSKKTSKTASLVFVRGVHKWPVNSPHKVPVTQKMLPFDDIVVIDISFTINGCIACVGKDYVRRHHTCHIQLYIPQKYHNCYD